jgi:hypothetical protein
LTLPDYVGAGGAFVRIIPSPDQKLAAKSSTNLIPFAMLLLTRKQRRNPSFHSLIAAGRNQTSVETFARLKKNRRAFAACFPKLPPFGRMNLYR